MIDTTWIRRGIRRARSCSERESIADLLCTLCNQTVCNMMPNTTLLFWQFPLGQGWGQGSAAYCLGSPPTGQPAPEAFGITAPVPQAEPAERLVKSLCAHSLSWGPSHCWQAWRGTVLLVGPGLTFTQAVPCAWQWLGLSSHPGVRS